MCDEEVMISHPILMSICVLSLKNIFVKASERQLDVCVCVCVGGGGVGGGGGGEKKEKGKNL